MPFAYKQVLLGMLFAFPVFSVAHAAIVTVHSTGIIRDGWDYPGMFTFGENLSGLPFDQSITIDTATLDQVTWPGVNQAGGVSQPNSVVYGQTSVGGEIYRWRLDGQEAHVELSSAQLSGNPNGGAQATMVSQGTNALNGHFTGVLNNTFSQSSGFLNSLEFAQNRDFSGLPGVRTFVMFMNNQPDGNQTYFDGFADTTTWEVSAVPEPDSAAMLLAGASLMALWARRRASCRG